MSSAPDLVVHVGLGAGGTLLHSAASLLEKELERQRVSIASPRSVPRTGRARLLVTAPAPPAPSDPSDAWPFCGVQRDEVAAIIERAGARRVRILLSPERQDRLIERGYRAAVAEGFGGTLVQRFPRYAEPLLDYRLLARELRSLPGVQDLRVVPLELVGAGEIAYVAALLDALDCARPLDLRPLAAWQVPREYGLRGMRIAMAMAPHLDTDDERAKVRDYVLSTFSVPVGAAPRIMTAQQRLDVVRACRPLNRRFFAEFVPDLADRSYGSRDGLVALGSTLSPVDVSPPPQQKAGRAARWRAQLGRVRQRFGRFARFTG